jgi:hypothetical protein
MIRKFASNPPRHNYTYYHECELVVEVNPDGTVTVSSDCQQPDGNEPFGQPLTVQEAYDAFLWYGHNGVGYNLRQFLLELGASIPPPFPPTPMQPPVPSSEAARAEIEQYCPKLSQLLSQL